MALVPQGRSALERLEWLAAVREFPRSPMQKGLRLAPAMGSLHMECCAHCLPAPSPGADNRSAGWALAPWRMGDCRPEADRHPVTRDRPSGPRHPGQLRQAACAQAFLSDVPSGWSPAARRDPIPGRPPERNWMPTSPVHTPKPAPQQIRCIRMSDEGGAIATTAFGHRTPATGKRGPIRGAG